MTLSTRAREAARRLGAAGQPDVEYVAQAVAVFAPLGWAVCGNWHVGGTISALELAASGASVDEVDEAITDVWNTQNETWLKFAAAPIRRWSNADQPFKQLLSDRAALIEKAIQHHQAGAYEASIPIILAQIDGLSRDLTGRSFFAKSNHDPYMDDQTLAGMEENLPVVRKLFSADVTPSGKYGLVSRHGVMHGRDLAYATRVNSTKTIVLAAALAEYFPRIADRHGTQQRTQHEQDVAGTTGTDDQGRLLDDRQVPELLQTAWDFDIAYMNATLLHGGVFDARAALRQAARKNGLDPEDFTQHADDTGNWWTYTLPAGQVLGYAARPSTNTARPHPDVWRWDAPNAPTAPPWSSSNGWHSDDEFPGLPNWEPRLTI